MVTNYTYLLRENIQNLVPYTSARETYTAKEGIFLDANESPYGPYNRYPDPMQCALKKRLAELKKCGVDQIFIGNGSDEVIDTVIRLFCEPNRDKALTFTPTYGMYKVSTQMNGIELIEQPLNPQFQIDVKNLLPYLDDADLKLIFLCSPNNPTANTIDKKTIEIILNRFQGIVLIDEAYIDFSDKASWLTLLSQYPRLIISQTLSKAWAMAGLRLGIAYASPELIGYFNLIKSPYNVSSVNQQKALEQLTKIDRIDRQVAELIAERKRVEIALRNLPSILKIYPSETNFLLIEVNDAFSIYHQLFDRNIIVRNRTNEITNCLRISIGTPQENTQLINAFNTLDYV